tara:strand:- start:6167 stop:6457 length:291 start_codon:yes stop_codon:yes gene_type:complete
MPNKKTNAVNLSNNTQAENKALMAKYKREKNNKTNTKSSKSNRNKTKKNNRTKSKKYTPGVDGPKYTGGSVPFVPGILGKIVKTKKIVDYVKKKLS